MTRRQVQRKTQRRWHLAPVITHGPEMLEGGRVLDEIDDALGALLWQSLRDVRLWAETPEAAQPLLFADGAGSELRALYGRADVDAELQATIQVLVRLVEDPRSLARAEIALACEQLAARATVRHWSATALDFAQAAALVDPEHAASALKVARLTSSRGEAARAETWLRRAVAVARRTDDWRTYAAALLELGKLYERRGNARSARRFFLRARRAAARHGEQAIRAEAERLANKHP